MSLKRIILLAVFCLIPALARAETVDLNRVIAAIEAPFKAKVPGDPKGRTLIEEFQASFSQESKIASVDRTQHGDGEVSFLFRPGGKNQDALVMFRWLYHRPVNQEIVSNGRSLWVYVPENNQIIKSEISQINQSQEENPVTFLARLGNLSRDFKIRWAEPSTDGNGNFLLLLEPRKSSQLIETIQIVVDRRAVSAYSEHQRTGDYFPIRATVVTDQNGNQTAIEFNDVQVNPGLPEEIFTLVPPPGVEVVSPSGKQLPN